MFFARAGIRLQTSARIAVTLAPVSIEKVNFVSAIFPATEVLFEAWTNGNELCSKSAIKLSLGLIQSGISVSGGLLSGKAAVRSSCFFCCAAKKQLRKLPLELAQAKGACMRCLQKLVVMLKIIRTTLMKIAR